MSVIERRQATGRLHPAGKLNNPMDRLNAATWRVDFDYGCALGDFRDAYNANGEA